jgi:glycosyltransferase involved in cell wall biosynthesis
MTPEIAVLLSTYNGERFLAEQLDSVLAQSHAPARVIVRDDGSSDQTEAILARYAADDGRFTVSGGANLGPVASFETLLRQAPECDLYAFCDQDDVWLPDKLANAVQTLAGRRQDQALLCCARLDYVAADLSRIGLSPLPRALGFGNALVENVATGCTIVMNRAARELLLRHSWDGAMMHDSWAYVAVTGAGEAVYDPRPAVLYRQHGANTIGGSPGMAGQLARRTARFVSRREKPVRYRDQAAAYRAAYGESLPEKNRRVLDRFVDSGNSLRARLAYAATMDVWRQTALDNLILRALIAAGQY